MAIAADLRDGYLTPQQALHLYGIEVSGRQGAT
jgi:hypothetical protein